jgi:hypothetical protein
MKPKAYSVADQEWQPYMKEMDESGEGRFYPDFHSRLSEPPVLSFGQWHMGWPPKRRDPHSSLGVAADFRHSTVLPDQIHLESRDDRQPVMSARDRLDMGRRRRRHGNMLRAQTGRTRDCQSPLACRVDNVLP